MRLAAHHLSLRFGAVNALTQISQEFPEGSRTVFWGPVGGGKTSLLKCLAGLITPTTGEVLWNGVATAARTAEDKRAADYKAAAEKCAALSGDAKSNCEAEVKARFGKR